MRFFIDPSEAQKLINYAEPRLEFSGVFHGADVEDTPDHESRKSYDFRPDFAVTPLVRDFEDRTYQLTRLPRGSAEELQILKYNVSGFYDIHNDGNDMNLYGNKWINLQLRVR